MAGPEVGDKAPDFTLPSTQGTLRLSELLKERKVVLAFYQEDLTPTWGTELSSFKEEYSTFQELGAEVVAISVDSLESHRRFAERLGGIPFPLASDEALKVARLYGVVGEDGRRSRRAIFVIEQDGEVVLKIPWYNPANTGQFMEVAEALGLE